MCVVSMVMDHYRDRWQDRAQDYQGLIQQWQGTQPPAPVMISAEELAEFRKLLDRAREYDKRNNEPNCELDEKRQAILAIAKQLGVEITFL